MLFRGYVQVCLEVSLQFIFGRAGAHLEASLRLACSAKVKGCFALGCLVMRFLSGSFFLRPSPSHFLHALSLSQRCSSTPPRPERKAKTLKLDWWNIDRVCGKMIVEQQYESSRHSSDLFFPVQRLHGFRQVVTHVQSQQKDEL